MTPPLPNRQGATLTALEPAPATNPGEDRAEQKLQTIRELLVGDELDGLDQRFHNLEATLESNYAKLGSELMTKFEALKVLNKSDIDDLGESVAEMVNQLREENQGLALEIKSGRRRLEELERNTGELKAVVAEEVRKLNAEFASKMSEFSQLIKAQQKEASRHAVTKKDFAQILSGLAGTLAAGEKSAEEASVA